MHECGFRPGAIDAGPDDVQLGALMLLSTIGRDEFKLPLAHLVASDYDPLIAVGLQVAEQRGEDSVSKRAEHCENSRRTA